MATTVARLQAVLSADTRDFDRGMASAETRMGGAHKVMLGASAGIIAGVGLIGAKAVSAAADYESALNQMRAVSGATSGEMDKISKLAIRLGNDIRLPGTSAKDAAQAMIELTKSGMSVDQTMKAVRSTLVLSAAAGIDNARAAEITSNALNVFRLDASKTGKVVDLLANAANASSLEITDVADSMKMAGAVFSGIQGPAVGTEQALKDLTVATALLGNAGIKGSDAGTSLKQTLLSLTGPSDKSKDAMKALYIAASGAQVGLKDLSAVTGSAGQRTEALKNMMKSAGAEVKQGGDIAFDAAGNMRPLNEIIELVRKGTAGMTQEQRAFYITQIFGADASRAVIALLNAESKGWDEMSEKVGKAGAAQELAQAKSKGLKGAQDALQSTLDTLAITFGLVLLPYVERATQALNKIAGVIAENRNAVIAVTGVLLTLAALYLTWRVNMIAAQAVQALLTTGQTAYALATGTATVAQQGLNTAMRANVIGLIITALELLVVGLVVAWQRSETFRAIVIGAWTAIRDTVSAVIGFFTSVAYPRLLEFINDVRGLFNSVKNFLEDNWKPLLVAMFTGLPGLLWLAIRNGWLDKFLDPLKDAFRGVRDWIKESIVDTIVGFFKELPGRLLAPLEDLARRARDIIGSIPFIGDAGDPTMTLPPIASPGPSSGGTFLDGALPIMAPFAQAASAYGLHVSSGLRPGAITKSGHLSDHAVGKALDLVGTAAGMAGFFMSLVGNPRVKQAFYDPLGSIFGGARSSYREGGHSDHVHVATYDKGGYLMPGLNLAYNGTGRPEPVGLATVNNFYFPNYVGSEDQLVDLIEQRMQRRAKQSGSRGV